MSASDGDSPVGGTVNSELITFGEDGKVDRQGFEGLLVLLKSGKARTPELLERLLVSIWALQSIDILLTQWPQTDLDTPPNISKQAQQFIGSIVRLQGKIGREALRVAQPEGPDNSREGVDGRHDPPPDTTEREDAAPEDGLKGKSVAGGDQPFTSRDTQEQEAEEEEQGDAIPRPRGGKDKVVGKAERGGKARRGRGVRAIVKPSDISQMLQTLTHKSLQLHQAISRRLSSPPTPLIREKMGARELQPLAIQRRRQQKSRILLVLA